MPKRSPSIRCSCTAALVAVAVAADDHVGRQRGEARGDLPDVEVVDLDDPRRGGHRVADLVDVHAARRGLQEDPARLAQQPAAGAQHDRGDEQRRDPVGPREAGDRGSPTPAIAVAMNAREVGEEVLVGALDVEAPAVGRASTHVAARFTTMPTSATISTGTPATSGGSTSRRTPSTTIEQPEHQQRRAVELRGEDLRAAQPERVRARAPAGAASRIATSASPIAAASVSMCAASESSASDGRRCRRRPRRP